MNKKTASECIVHVDETKSETKQYLKCLGTFITQYGGGDAEINPRSAPRNYWQTNVQHINGFKTKQPVML